MVHVPTFQRFILTFLCFILSLPALAAPSVTDALKLTPVQPGIPFDTPDEQDQATCTIKAEKVNGSTAWVIRDSQGTLLRQFADADGDNVVDTWSYYHDGLEIYRDIDANHNGKADQYRWFHSAGSRWGIDQDEDGAIDRWKLISAEEATEEAVEALRTGSLQRFASLLLSAEEIEKLGLPEPLAAQLAKRTETAKVSFRALVDEEFLSSDSEFSDFGGTKPGIVPAGTRGSTKDLLVYENVWAMVRQENQHQQLHLGTMISFNGSWKLTDGPTRGGTQEVASGFFYGSGGGAGEASATPTSIEPTERMQEILADLEKLDQQIVSVAGDERSKLNRKRANLLADLADVAPNDSEREQWLKQLADMVSAAAQDGSFPEGIEYLKKWETKLDKEGDVNELAGYFQFQRMLAEYYGVTLANPDIDPAKAHSDWLASLETFVDDHPESEHGAEALRQLAMGSEIAGENKAATQWYRRLLEQFPKSAHAALSRGALTRLSSEGREIVLRGTALKGDKVDLKEYRGKAVVIQYWTTSCDVCTADHAVLGNLNKKYGRRALEIVGVNLDYSRDKLIAYLEENRLPWKQLYESGGFDSRLATEMGVVTVPLMIMIGPDGKVVSSNIRAEEIEGELKKLLQAKSQAANPPLKR